jgi:hypothetical protein
MEQNCVSGKVWRTRRSDKKRQGIEAGICEGERIFERETRSVDNRGYEELNDALVADDPCRLREWLRFNCARWCVLGSEGTEATTNS